MNGLRGERVPGSDSIVHHDIEKKVLEIKLNTLRNELGKKCEWEELKERKKGEEGKTKQTKND